MVMKSIPLADARESKDRPYRSRDDAFSRVAACLITFKSPTVIPICCY
jgi:hypothetical protein